MPEQVAPAYHAFAGEIDVDWPPERAFIDEAYASFDWPFAPVPMPEFEMRVEWPLARLLGYVSSYSAVKLHRERTGEDPVARHAPAIARAWGDPHIARALRWPLFVHARRKGG